jgi:hypothetical protein
MDKTVRNERNERLNMTGFTISDFTQLIKLEKL